MGVYQSIAVLRWIAGFALVWTIWRHAPHGLPIAAGISGEHLLAALFAFWVVIGGRVRADEMQQAIERERVETHRSVWNDIIRVAASALQNRAPHEADPETSAPTDPSHRQSTPAR